MFKQSSKIISYSILQKIKTTPFLFLLPISKSYYSNSDELKSIKASLNIEEKNLFKRLSDKLSPLYLLKNNKKTNIINHTTQQIPSDTNNSSESIEFSRKNFNIKNLHKSAEEDIKLVNKLYQFQSEKLSKRNYSTEEVEIFLEKIKKIDNINHFFEDKRFQILVSDFLFIVNDVPTAKELFQMTFLAFVFSYYGNLKEFHDKVFSRFLNLIRVSEILDLLLLIKYFKQINNENFVREGGAHLITEIHVRFDPNIYKKNKNILIENDELVKILITMNDTNNLDSDLIKCLDKHIEDNLDGFSISELIEYSLFFVHFQIYQNDFIGFFKKIIYEKKLKRNMKNMSADKLYQICFILYNFKMFDLKNKTTNSNNNSGNDNFKIFDNFRTILETLLKNDSLNTDIQEYLIIKNSDADFIYDMVNLIIKVLENSDLNINNLQNYIDPSTKNLIDLLFKVVFHYFLANQRTFTTEQTFNFLTVLEKKKLIENKLLNEIFLGLVDKIPSMDYKNLVKFLQFALNTEAQLKGTKRLKNNLINLFLKSDDAKIINEILLFFTRSKDLEFLNITNLDIIFKKYGESIFEKMEFPEKEIERMGEMENKDKIKKIDLKDQLNDQNKDKINFEFGNKIKMLWNVSNLVEIINLNFGKIQENLINNYAKDVNEKNKQNKITIDISEIEKTDEIRMLKNDLKNFFAYYYKSIKYLKNSSKEEIDSLSAFEISLIFHSIKNIEKIKNGIENFFENIKITLNIQNTENFINFLLDKEIFNKTNEEIISLLKIIEKLVLYKLEEFDLLEYLLVFYTYCERKCISDDLLEASLNIIINNLDQFSMYQLDFLSYSLENINAKNIEVLGLINRMKIYLTKKILEKTVEEIDVNIIKDSINEIMEEEETNKIKNKDNKQFKKLI